MNIIQVKGTLSSINNAIKLQGVLAIPNNLRNSNTSTELHVVCLHVSAATLQVIQQLPGLQIEILFDDSLLERVWENINSITPTEDDKLVLALPDNI